MAPTSDCRKHVKNLLISLQGSAQHVAVPASTWGRILAFPTPIKSAPGRKMRIFRGKYPHPRPAWAQVGGKNPRAEPGPNSQADYPTIDGHLDRRPRLR